MISQNLNWVRKKKNKTNLCQDISEIKVTSQVHYEWLLERQVDLVSNKILKNWVSRNLKYNPDINEERKKRTFCLTFLPTRGHLCLWVFLDSRLLPAQRSLSDDPTRQNRNSFLRVQFGKAKSASKENHSHWIKSLIWEPVKFYPRISRHYHCQNYHKTESGTLRWIWNRNLETSPLSIVHVLQATRNFVISRCRFAEDGKEMCQELQRTCTAIILLR